MASMAAVMTDAPAPLDGTSLDPYGQLLKMLLPRANSIVIYDRLGVSLWASEERRRRAAEPDAAGERRRAGRARGHRPWLRRAAAGRADRLLLRLARQRRQPAGRRRHGQPRVEPRAAPVHAGAGAGAAGPAVPRARARRAIEHRPAAAQPERARPRPGTAARLGAGRSRWRELHRRLRDAGAELRRPPRLRRRRAADPGQEHRGLPHLVRHAAACRRRDPHAHAQGRARLGAAAAPDDDLERAAQHGPVRQHPVQDPGLPRHARRAAHPRRAGAVQAAAGARLRPAAGAHRRAARPPRRLHPDELVRPDHRPADAAGVREACQRGAHARIAAQGQLRHLHRHRPAARAEREARHARR